MRTYIIVPMNEITQEMLDDCVQKITADLRKTNDGQYAILKYEISPDPAWAQGYTRYTGHEIREILDQPEWQIEEE